MGSQGGLPSSQEGTSHGHGKNRYLPQSFGATGLKYTPGNAPRSSVVMCASDRPQVSGESQNPKPVETKPETASNQAEAFRVTSDELNTLYQYAALGIITLIRTAAYWQSKSIGYFYGFKGQGYQERNVDFEISAAYP
jgi:hypothetical protein